MAASATEIPRAYTLSLPEATGEQLEAIAREENESPSEFIARALRLHKWKKFEAHLEEVRRSLPPTDYTEDDVERLVDEVREEMYNEREAERARRT